MRRYQEPDENGEVKPYPKRWTKLTIHYIDGVKEEFTITASTHIMRHLLREANQTGMFVLRNDDEKTQKLVPLEKIRSIDVADVPDPEQVVEASE